MTIGKKLHQTLASLRSAKADMETFSLSTEDKNAQKMYSDFENQLDSMINSFAGRVNYVEQQEPQYNVKKQIQQQSDNQQS